jgi:hypothetical protein
MLNRQHVATGFDAYFRTVQRRGGEGIPTFSEAQRDFSRMGGRYNEYRS